MYFAFPRSYVRVSERAGDRERKRERGGKRERERETERGWETGAIRKEVVETFNRDFRSSPTREFVGSASPITYSYLRVLFVQIRPFRNREILLSSWSARLAQRAAQRPT